MEDIKVWQTRPLARLYPIVYLDAVRIKVRDNGHVVNKAVYLALGVDLDGQKDVLEMWIAETEGAKFWAMILTELKNRGVEDIFIICVDGRFPMTRQRSSCCIWDYKMLKRYGRCRSGNGRTR